LLHGISGVKAVFRLDTKSVSTFKDKRMKKTVWNAAIPTAKGNFIQLAVSHNIHEGENLSLTELPPTLKANTLGLQGNY